MHKKELELSRPLSVGNSVSCGAFLALCFLHLLPHSQEKWKQVFTLLPARNDTLEAGALKSRHSRTTFSFDKNFFLRVV